MLLDLDSGSWDDELLTLFGVERAVLPEVVPSSGIAGEASLLGATVPISGIAGDQQAALFGQGCFAPGEAKATYGTGSCSSTWASAVVRPPRGSSPRRPLEPGAGRRFAAEGSVLVGGASLQWLRDGLGVIDTARASGWPRASNRPTASISSPPSPASARRSGGPTRGLICGLTRGTNRAHLVRAALEAVAHRSPMCSTRFRSRSTSFADGGAAANRFLMQFQADLIGSPVEVAADADATAMGAALLAGLAVGMVRHGRARVADPSRRALRAADERSRGRTPAQRMARGRSARAPVTLRATRCTVTAVP